MRRVFLALAGTVFLLCAPRPSWSDHFPVSVIDARGVAVTLPAAPKRIVSLTPGTTEMLFALGAGPRVVGDTSWCNYPPAAQHVAKIGDLNPNYEKIVALRPDLVVVDEVAEKNAVARLTALHIPIFVIHPASYPTVEDTLVALGRALGLKQAGLQAKAAMEKKRASAASVAATFGAKHPRVLVVVGTNPLWVAGRGTFLGDVVRMAGGANLGDAAPGYASESKEWVVSHPPDIILAGVNEQAALRHDPVLSHLSAVRNGRMADSGGDPVMRPGPRLGDGLVSIAATLRRLTPR